MIVDIIIIAVLALAILIGKKRGLTVCLVNIFSLLIALIMAFMFYKPVGNLIIQKTNIDENVKTIIVSNIPISDTNLNVEANSNLPKKMQEYINSTATSLNKAKDDAIETVAIRLTEQVINVISFIMIFVVVRAILLLVKILSKLINKLPILKQINSIGGAICGFVEGAILVYTVFAIISIIAPTLNDTNLLKQINNSTIGKQMYTNNIIINKVYKVK